MPTIPELIDKLKNYSRATDSNRTAKDGDGDDDETEEVEDIDAPKAGSTIEDPPNGGTRAWLIVVSCALITFVLGIIEPLVVFSLLDSKDDVDDLDEDGAFEIYLVFLSISSVYAPIASVSMSTLGYELTIHAGSWCMAFSFLILSFIEDIHGIKFLIYVIAGVGSSFIQLGVLIPVLEYFTTKRVRALMFTKISRYLGRLIPAIIFVAADKSISWNKSYRICLGLSIAIGIVGLTIPSLKLKMKSDGRTSFIARTLGMDHMEVIKNAFLWLVCFLFFVYQIAVEPPNAELTNFEEIPERLKIEGNLAKVGAYFLTSIIGLIAGAFLGWLFKFSARHKFFGCLKEVPTPDEIFNMIVIIMIIAPFLMAILCFIAPEAANFPYFFILNILFSTQQAFIEELRDDSVPDVFGRQNVKFVEGILQMFVGIGGIIGSESSVSLKWKNSFRMGGGMLFVTTAVSILLLILRTGAGADILKIDKLVAVVAGGTRPNRHPPESHTQSTSSGQPRADRDRTRNEMSNTNMKFKNKIPYGPSKTKFVLPDQHRLYSSHETLRNTGGSVTSNNTNIQATSETQQVSTGHTVYTNIQTSMSPGSYNLVQQNPLPINPHTQYIIYSYNITPDTYTH